MRQGLGVHPHSHCENKRLDANWKLLQFSGAYTQTSLEPFEAMPLADIPTNCSSSSIAIGEIIYQYILQCLNQMVPYGWSNLKKSRSPTLI